MNHEDLDQMVEKWLDNCGKIIFYDGMGRRNEFNSIKLEIEKVLEYILPDFNFEILVTNSNKPDHIILALAIMKARSTFVFTKSIANPNQTPQTQNYAQILESDESRESRPHNDRSSGLGSGRLSFKVFNRFYSIRIISSSSSKRVKSRKKGCHTSGTTNDSSSKKPGQTSAGSNRKLIHVTPDCLTSNLESIISRTMLDSPTDKPKITPILSPFNFDTAILLLFEAIKTNAVILLVDKLMIHQNLSRILSDNFVTRLFITPSLLRQTRINFSTLRVLMLGGEECLSYPELVSIFGSNMDKMTIYNLYGLTEVSIWSSIVKILPSDVHRVPIMRSKDDLLFGNRVEIRNNRIFIKPNAIRKCSINGQFFDEIEADSVDLIGESIYFHHREKNHFVKRNGQKVSLSLIRIKSIEVFNAKGCHVVLHLKRIVLVILQSKDKKDDNQSKSYIEASNLKRLKEVTNELPDRILEISHYPMTHNQKLDEPFLKRWVANELDSKGQVLNLRTNFDQIYTILIGQLNPNGNFFAEGGDSLSAIQISHLINHPFPDQFQNSLRTKSLRNVQLDLSRLDEHFTNSKTVTKPLRSCIFDETRPRLKIFEDYHRIGEHDNVIAKTLRRRWTLKTSSCADGQPIIFGEIEDINELFGAISCHDGSLVCFKLVSGDEIFQLKLSSRAMTLSVWVGYICATTSNGEFFLICHKSGKIALRHQIESPSGSISSDPCHIRCPATFLVSIRTRSKSDSVIQPTQTGRLTSIRKFKVFNGRLEPDKKFKLLEIDDSLNTKVSLVPSSEGPSSILICSMKGKIIVADLDTGLVQ